MLSGDGGGDGGGSGAAKSDFSVEFNLAAMKYLNLVVCLLYASVQGVVPHGGRRTTAAAMIDRCEKFHLAENLSFCSYSAFCAPTAARHHAAMISRFSGHEEATSLAWMLPR